MAKIYFIYLFFPEFIQASLSYSINKVRDKHEIFKNQNTFKITLQHGILIENTGLGI